MYPIVAYLLGFCYSLYWYACGEGTWLSASWNPWGHMISRIVGFCVPEAAGHRLVVLFFGSRAEGRLSVSRLIQTALEVLQNIPEDKLLVPV